MALQVADEERERATLQPLADELMQRIREHDPEATFVFGPGVDPGIWLLDAYVTPSLRDDWDFVQSLVDVEVDFQIENGITVAPILLTRRAAQ